MCPERANAKFTAKNIANITINTVVILITFDTKSVDSM